MIQAMEQIHNITLDMSLSRREEKKQIKAIKRSLSREDRETLSSSEED
ncbi:unnamed protein product [Toxocara canis]|uniref:Uncharacterized protein n=1 Tax=Toxocara canis TaxID=6265 RepID=A0A3P7GRJ8_TOXCA|nr:unnamed protein product [Toxocara canis]